MELETENQGQTEQELEVSSDVAEEEALGSIVGEDLPVPEMAGTSPNAQQPPAGPGSVQTATVTPTGTAAATSPEKAVAASSTPAPAAQTSKGNESGGGGAGAEARAAAALVTAYKVLPGIVPELVNGQTVEEVTASLEVAKKAYGEVQAQVLKQQGLAVPPAHGGAPAVKVPETPLGMIVAGLEQGKK